MHLITLSNDFHRTAITVRWDGDADTPPRQVYEAIEAKAQAWDPAARRKWLRIKRALCGVHGCKCGVLREAQR